MDPISFLQSKTLIFYNLKYQVQFEYVLCSYK